MNKTEMFVERIKELSDENKRDLVCLHFSHYRDT